MVGGGIASMAAAAFPDPGCRIGLSTLEVTDEVFKTPASIVFDHAGNRLQ
jgi:ornithine carbamoyltransferase